jgi:RHS repeat-associated protein
VDSLDVGGSLASVFDQSGRLLSDTAYVGARARATNYTYDTLDRVATRTDTLGAWTTRYEADRGLADTLLTPFGDTVTYAFDGRGRPIGPSIQAGATSPSFSVSPDWNLTGALRLLTTAVPGASAYVIGQFDRNDFVDPDFPGAALGPVWTEQHGSGAATDSVRDSVTYDGWERLIAFVEAKNRTVAERDTFAFDRAGNIAAAGETAMYDAATDRDTMRVAAGHTWRYRYDRAGNLVQTTDSSGGGTITYAYTYDALDQLRVLKRNGTLIAKYGYDVIGRRTVKRVYQNTTGGTIAFTRFIYRGGAVGFETDSGGTIGLRFTWGMGADALIAVDKDTTHFYVALDKLGSVRGLVKKDGTWVLSERFGPYGVTIARDTNAAVTIPALRYAWTGREYDAELGWYFFRARYFDPAARRFTQEDPEGHGGGSNVYAYGGGSPLDGRDPSGMMFDAGGGNERPELGVTCVACTIYDANDGLWGGDAGNFAYMDVLAAENADQNTTEITNADIGAVGRDSTVARQQPGRHTSGTVCLRGRCVGLPHRE